MPLFPQSAKLLQLLREPVEHEPYLGSVDYLVEHCCLNLREIAKREFLSVLKVCSQGGDRRLGGKRSQEQAVSLRPSVDASERGALLEMLSVSRNC
jgi:hypothetical protein